MIGERLKEERKRLGFSQEGFASVAGITRRPYVEWEAGNTFPNAAQLVALAEAGVDVLYVLTGKRSTNSDVASPALTPRQVALIDNYEHTDEAGKKIIEAAAFAAAQPKAAHGGKR